VFYGPVQKKYVSQLIGSGGGGDGGGGGGTTMKKLFQ
jgi:hypothetical protein